MAQAQPWTLLMESLPMPNKPKNLKIGIEISRGSWGTVYDGMFDRHPVAVKAIHPLLTTECQGGGQVTVSKFYEECHKIKGLEHDNVIKFRGAFKDVDLGPVLVMDKMKEDLWQFLDSRRKELSIREQLRISLEITQGVAFLHQLTPPMVHCDLNDRNVMLSFEGVAKIGDFGQSKLKQQLYLTTTQPGAVAFMPPEALCPGNSKYDESLDMFSLGVLMLEIGTQKQPICNFQGIGTTDEVERRKADLGIMSHLHPLKPSILCCLRDDPELRLKASELLVVLPVLFGNVEEVQQTLAEHNNCKSQQELEEVQQELEEVRHQFKTIQEENAEVQQELDRKRQELEGVQQELEETNSERERCLEAHHASQKNLHESQQEVARLKRTQHELEGVQRAHTRTRRELSKTRQELEGVQQAHTRTQQELSKTRQELEGLQQELEKITSAVQKLSDSLSAKEKCLETHHANQKKLQKELQAKSEELKGAQVQLRDLHSELTFLSEENKHLKESLNFKQSATVMSISNENNPTVHCSTKTPQRQWDLDNAYLGVQDKSTIQTTVTRCLHSLEVQIFDSVAKADFPDGSVLHATCLRYSQGYKDWELGYEIILCAVLQLCYEVCRTMLSNDVVHDAVGAYNDGRSFAPEVVAMLKDSLAELDSSVLADTACHLVAHSFSVNACTEQNNSRRYAAVYSLITAYLKNPVQDYLASAKQAVLADRELGFVTANPCVEEFVKKVLPSCWELATKYMPPIFACDQNVKVNGALHDLSQVSSRMGMVQSYLFPLVYYCGEVQKKARVLAEMP